MDLEKPYHAKNTPTLLGTRNILWNQAIPLKYHSLLRTMMPTMFQTFPKSDWTLEQSARTNLFQLKSDLPLITWQRQKTSTTLMHRQELFLTTLIITLTIKSHFQFQNLFDFNLYFYKQIYKSQNLDNSLCQLIEQIVLQKYN